MMRTLRAIVEQLEKCGFVTDDGLHDLKMNAAFIELKELSKRLHIIVEVPEEDGIIGGEIVKVNILRNHDMDDRLYALIMNAALMEYAMWLCERVDMEQRDDSAAPIIIDKENGGEYVDSGTVE